MTGLNVLSLFDGMSCGMIALDKLGIKVNRYLASEVDKHAISVSQSNYLNIEHVGDVRNVRAENLPNIDLLIGGSPCQGFSFAGKQMNFDDPRSKLFFEFVRLYSDLMPKYFLLENVRMKKEYQDVISSYLGCEPIEINSSLVSAQNRRRLFWTNIPIEGQPEDKGILLKDIVHEYVDDPEMFMKGKQAEWVCNNGTDRIKKGHMGIGRDKALYMTARQYANWNGNFWFEALKEYIVPFDKTLKILDKEVERGKVGYFRKDSQANRIYYIHDKAVCLTGSSGGGAAKMGQYLFGQIVKPINRHESRDDLICLAGIGEASKDQKLQRDFSQGNRIYSTQGKNPTLSSQMGGKASGSSLIFGCITPDRIEKRQNGQRFNDGKKFYTLTAQDKHGVLLEGYIRKLTPVECERLQTVPDNYTVVASNAQRYKMLGERLDCRCNLSYI